MGGVRRPFTGAVGVFNPWAFVRNRCNLSANPSASAAALEGARLVGSRRSRRGAAYPRRFEGTFLPSPRKKVTLEGWRSAGRVKSNQNSSFGCKNLLA